MATIEQLHDAWERAIERERHADAVRACLELEALDPKEPLWSHRAGESYRRLGKMKEAEDAFVRATDRYAAKGFVPRAIAMAKLVVALNPKRTDVLERVSPPKPKVEGGPDSEPPTIDAPAPGLAAQRKGPPPLPPRPVVIALAPAKDAADDEIRFEDSQVSSIPLSLKDVSTITELTEADLMDDASLPPVPIASLPVPSEPSFDYTSAMASFRLFMHLSRDALIALSRATELVEFVPEAHVIVKDEPAFALFLIVHGEARVEVRGSPPIILHEGDVFGESCLLDEGERQANVRAETTLMTLRITKKKLDALAKEFPEIGDSLFELLARRLVTNLMYASPLFTVFEPKLRLELAQMFEVRRAGPGLVLAEKGRKSDGLYVLLAGHVEGGGVRIARGTAFGHASLMGGAPSDVTITATSEAVLLRLPAQKFSSLAALYPPALAYLADTAGEPLPPSRLLE